MDSNKLGLQLKDSAPNVIYRKIECEDIKINDERIINEEKENGQFYISYNMDLLKAKV